MIHNRRSPGFSLVEGLATLAVLAVTTGLAVPHLGAVSQQRRLDGSVAQLLTDIQFARGLAVAHNSNVRISFPDANAGQSCYVIHTGSSTACKCTAGSSVPVCEAGTQAFKSVGFSEASGMRLSSNVGSILFDSSKGTSTPTGTVRVKATTGTEVRIIVNLMGRTRTCTTQPTAGYTKC